MRTFTRVVSGAAPPERTHYWNPGTKKTWCGLVGMDIMLRDDQMGPQVCSNCNMIISAILYDEAHRESNEPRFNIFRIEDECKMPYLVERNITRFTEVTECYNYYANTYMRADKDGAVIMFVELGTGDTYYCSVRRKLELVHESDTLTLIDLMDRALERR